MSYLEVLLAIAIITVALVPAIEALYAGMLGSQAYQSGASEHYRVAAGMEGVLAEPYSTLKASAAAAGDSVTPSSYSDPLGADERRLVFLGRYDPDNVDGDNDPFTVPDPNLDGDNDPFTGYAGLLWVRVEIAGTVAAVESLVAP